MEERTSVRLTIPRAVDPVLVTGTADEVLRAIEGLHPSTVTVRGNEVLIAGDSADVQAVSALFTHLFEAILAGERPTAAMVQRVSALLREDAYAPSVLLDDVLLSHNGRTIRPKTAGQKRYVDAIRTHTITFGLGPAGTGKTYLAMAMAVAALRRKEISRLILTRPVVEAGESLGFLPGTLEEKINPYIRPLYDALYSMMEPERVQVLLELGTIEIAPLAFMRGRTLSDAFVILDEAQNTTPEQMKMFLTRLGLGSRFVITGDASQTDLPRGASSLGATRRILDGVEDIAFVELSGADVVRHNLVAKIVAAYERAAEKPYSPTGV